MDRTVRETAEGSEEYRQKQVLEKSGIGPKEKDAGEGEIDLMQEFETDVFLRTCVVIPQENPLERPFSFAQGVTAYQAAAEADKAAKRYAAITSKKA